MVHILIADCHDSFVYNLVELLRKAEECSFEIYAVEECTSLSLDRFDGVLLSPGPGHPEETEGLRALIERSYTTHPLLGVCLGHQALACFFGGTIRQLPHPLHGHADYLLFTDSKHHLFSSFPSDSTIGRYHSWVVCEETFPPSLTITARAKEDHSIMAFRHRELPIFGVQFHPESYLTPEGNSIVAHWLQEVAQRKEQKKSRETIAS